MLINEGDFKFSKITLPNAAQLTPIYAIAAEDFDQDGDLDIVMGGNLYKAKPEVGRYDASYGVFLENKGNLNFETQPSQSGFIIEGEVRSITVIPNKSKLIVARNNDSLVQFSYGKKKR